MNNGVGYARPAARPNRVVLGTDDIGADMLEEVRRFTSRPGTIVLVVVPELIVSKWRYLLLHSQNALFVKRLFLFEPNVILSSVPYVLEDRAPAAASAG